MCVFPKSQPSTYLNVVLNFRPRLTSMPSSFRLANSSRQKRKNYGNKFIFMKLYLLFKNAGKICAVKRFNYIVINSRKCFFGAKLNQLNVYHLCFVLDVFYFFLIKSLNPLVLITQLVVSMI